MLEITIVHVVETRRSKKAPNLGLYSDTHVRWYYNHIAKWLCPLFQNWGRPDKIPPDENY